MRWWMQPSHEGLDFRRGQYVAALPGGEASVVASLDALRAKVEQVRLSFLPSSQGDGG